MTTLLPRQPAPDLAIDLVGGGHWKITEQAPSAFTMLVFFRHRHCSVCKTYLQELDGLHDAFMDAGAAPIAISTDTELNSEKMRSELSIEKLQIGYGLSRASARDWGLYLSSGRHDTDPAVFTEPALFLVDKNMKLYFASIQSMPFGRSSLPEMLKWIPKLIEKNIPARGELSFDAVLSEAAH